MTENIIEIKSLDDEALKAYTKLTDVELRNRLEPEKGIFIAESPKVIKLALECGYKPVSLLMDRKHIEGQGAEIIEKCGNIPVYTANSDVLQNLTGYELTRGILCAMKRPLAKDADEICKNSRRIAVLEAVVDATNIGAIFRSASALGIDAVLLTPTCRDPLQRRAVRVSMGTVLTVPWARICEDEKDWNENGIAKLHEMGFATAAMALSDDSVPIDDKKVKSEKRLAIILGTEGDGLAKKTVADCDYTVKIPMYHGVDSLNVAAAGAVAFWELR